MRRLDLATRQRLLSGMGRPMGREDLRRLGITEADLKRLVRNGALQHVRPWYVDGSLDRKAAQLLCALAGHPGGVFSHFTAARLAGLRTWITDRTAAEVIWLTRREVAGRHSLGPGVAMRFADLPADDIQTFRVTDLDDDLIAVDGARMTTPARTVVDLARQLPRYGKRSSPSIMRSQRWSDATSLTRFSTDNVVGPV